MLAKFNVCNPCCVDTPIQVRVTSPDASFGLVRWPNVTAQFLGQDYGVGCTGSGPYVNFTPWFSDTVFSFWIRRAADAGVFTGYTDVLLSFDWKPPDYNWWFFVYDGISPFAGEVDVDISNGIHAVSKTIHTRVPVVGCDHRYLAILRCYPDQSFEVTWVSPTQGCAAPDTLNVSLSFDGGLVTSNNPLTRQSSEPNPVWFGNLDFLGSFVTTGGYVLQGLFWLECLVTGDYRVTVYVQVTATGYSHLFATEAVVPAASVSCTPAFLVPSTTVTMSEAFPFTADQNMTFSVTQ